PAGAAHRGSGGRRDGGRQTGVHSSDALPSPRNGYDALAASLLLPPPLHRRHWSFSSCGSYAWQARLLCPHMRPKAAEHLGVLKVGPLVAQQVPNHLREVDRAEGPVEDVRCARVQQFFWTVGIDPAAQKAGAEARR